MTLTGRRIVVVLFNLELGGAERQALMLARYLAEQQQAAVEVWGFNKSGPVAEICEQHRLPWRLVSFPFDNARLWRLRRLAAMFREARAEILLPYTFVPNVVCGLVWRWAGARACVWNQRDEGRMPLVTEWARAAVERTPLFISNSAGGARFLTEKLNTDPLKIKIIKNGIDLALPRDDRAVWRDRLAVSDDAFVACMVANLHDKKDHQTLLRAWRRVVNERNGSKPVLVLAGRHDGAYESIAALSRELNLSEHVRFAGQVSDVSGLLSAADLGVFSSVYEGCPNGVLESMAAGLAVAGTDVDPISSLLGPAGSPFLAAPGNDESLAAAILKLANDSDLRATIGSTNRRRVEENYTALRMCEETVAALEELKT
jgi:glycosyltransferase involved in cell wall biosynthesis